MAVDVVHCQVAGGVLAGGDGLGLVVVRVGELVSVGDGDELGVAGAGDGDDDRHRR